MGITFKEFIQKMKEYRAQSDDLVKQALSMPCEDWLELDAYDLPERTANEVEFLQSQMDALIEKLEGIVADHEKNSE